MELVKDFWGLFWAIGVLVLGAVAQFFRLESRANTNSRDIQAVRQDMIKYEIRAEKQRSEDLANRQRDWEQMASTLKEMRSDIKVLLQRDRDDK